MHCFSYEKIHRQIMQPNNIPIFIDMILSCFISKHLISFFTLRRSRDIWECVLWWSTKRLRTWRVQASRPDKPRYASNTTRIRMRLWKALNQWINCRLFSRTTTADAVSMSSKPYAMQLQCSRITVCFFGEEPQMWIGSEYGSIFNIFSLSVYTHTQNTCIYAKLVYLCAM